MNRCIRGPYVQWCERRSSSLTSGDAVYSISGSGFFYYCHFCELGNKSILFYKILIWAATKQIQLHLFFDCLQNISMLKNRNMKIVIMGLLGNESSLHKKFVGQSKYLETTSNMLQLQISY